MEFRFFVFIPLFPIEGDDAQGKDIPLGKLKLYRSKYFIEDRRIQP